MEDWNEQGHDRKTGKGNERKNFKVYNRLHTIAWLCSYNQRDWSRSWIKEHKQCNDTSDEVICRGKIGD